MFGCCVGAYTGASREQPGLVTSADRGVLFLDELDSMSRRMQAAMLRVLDTGEYRQLGASQIRHADFRLISAAHPRLFKAIDEAGFRQDLFYRLSALQVVLRPFETVRTMR